MGMTVNAKSARRCCKYCFTDFGKSNNAKEKTAKRRQIKRSERHNWKKSLD